MRRCAAGPGSGRASCARSQASNAGHSRSIVTRPFWPNPDARLYVCGPSGFIDYVVNTAKSLGWAQDRIHLEYFGAPVQDTSGDEGFEVRIASTGKVYPIAPDVSVVEALRKEGIDILTSCEQGVCGTCLTRVLEGEVDHRDMYLTDEEKAANEQFMPCCSRARSKLLVLDL